MERTADVSAFLAPHDRQVFDSLVRKAEQAFADRLALSPSSQGRRPEEPRVPRRPAGDRMRVG